MTTPTRARRALQELLNKRRTKFGPAEAWRMEHARPASGVTFALLYVHAIEAWAPPETDAEAIEVVLAQFAAVAGLAPDRTDTTDARTRRTVLLEEQADAVDGCLRFDAGFSQDAARRAAEAARRAPTLLEALARDGVPDPWLDAAIHHATTAWLGWPDAPYNALAWAVEQTLTPRSPIRALSGARPLRHEAERWIRTLAEAVANARCLPESTREHAEHALARLQKELEDRDWRAVVARHQREASASPNRSGHRSRYT